MKQKIMIFAAVIALLLSSCTPLESTENSDLRVMATTSIIADVVQNIAGDNIDVFVLLPAGSDPHSFSPTPQDIVAIEQSDLVFTNGLGLEDNLADFLVSASESIEIIPLSNAILLDEIFDPHTWMDPTNVSMWADSIAQALASIDPSNSLEYRANAAAYKVELDILDQWIIQQFETIEVGRRVLLSDHEYLTHFANRYDFEIPGTLISGTSSLGEASASGLADLENLVNQREIAALILGSPESEALAVQFSVDAGLQLVPIFVESLSGDDGPAPTYIELMRYDVTNIANALR